MGSTGSIGTQTLDVIAASGGAYRVRVLAAHSSVELLARQAQEFRPDVVVVGDPEAASAMSALLPRGTTLEVGPDQMGPVAATADITVNGVVGFAGLGVTLAVLSAGKRLALANKESLIAAGPVVQPLRDTPGAELIPVDSEHCAVHQALRAADGSRRVANVVLTASGGPFRGRSVDDLAAVTIDDALAHPTWSMGPKITIDSSTLMNKGLEVIEAHELFGTPYDQIDVVVHPQSIVHSMVTYTDGATIAQLSMPDMRLPIGYALAYPDRLPVGFGSMDFSTPTTLEFEPPDRQAFPCLDLAYGAGRAGGTAPAWLSAANEVAVDAFLSGVLAWRDIAALDAAALDRWDGSAAGSVDDVLAADSAARRVAAELISERAGVEMAGSTR
jgi:1-deoxy-D-xylulose-5-phosphate reductoisomerase